MQIHPEKQIFDTVEAGILRMPIDVSTGTGTTPTINANVATYAKTSSNVAAAGEEAITITNSKIAATSIVFVAVLSSTGGTAGYVSSVVSAGQVVVTITNVHASTALTAYTIGFLVINAA